MMTPKLVNLAPAVSTEVSRWCFSHWHIPLHEQLHVPVFHVLALFWHRSSNEQRPVVRVDKTILRKEDQIIEYFDARVPEDRKLVPEGELGSEVMALVDYFRTEFRRAGVVKYMYYNLLKDRKLVWESFTIGTPWYERWAAFPLFPLIKLGLRIGLGLNAENADKGLENIRAGFDRVDGLLSDGRSYLTGETFTLADLAFASSAAPALLLDGYQGNLPSVEDVPEFMQKVVVELRERPAGKYAAKLYKEHRNSSISPG